MLVEKMDDFLLELFAVIVSEFQRRTGKNQYFLVRLVLAFMGMTILVTLWSFFALDHATIVNGIGLGFMVIFLTLIAMESAGAREAEKDEISPRRADMYFIFESTPTERVICVGLAVGAWSNACSTTILLALGQETGVEALQDIMLALFLGGAVAYFYLISITPLPPKKEKYA